MGGGVGLKVVRWVGLSKQGLAMMDKVGEVCVWWAGPGRLRHEVGGISGGGWFGHMGPMVGRAWSLRT